MTAAYEVQGLAQFRKELARAGAEFPLELKKANEAIAAEVATTAAGIAASSPDRMRQWAALAIWGRGTALGASVGVRASAQVPFAVPALWGSMKRTGWFADPKYAGSTGHQFPAWVGNTWEPGGPGGPYAINPAISASLPEIEAAYARAIDELGHLAGFH